VRRKESLRTRDMFYGPLISFTSSGTSEHLQPAHAPSHMMLRAAVSMFHSPRAQETGREGATLCQAAQRRSQPPDDVFVSIHAEEEVQRHVCLISIFPTHRAGAKAALAAEENTKVPAIAWNGFFGAHPLVSCSFCGRF
jgi:hypothetical protein